MIVKFYVNVRFNLKLSQKSLNPNKSTMNNEIVFNEKGLEGFRRKNLFHVKLYNLLGYAYGKNRNDGYSNKIRSLLIMSKHRVKILET